MRFLPLRLLASALLAFAAATASADVVDPWTPVRAGAIVLVRHTTAPGVGDPANFRLGDCATQRNLDATGRAEAVRLGDAFRTHGIRVDTVLSSQWCRTRDAAELAFPGRVRDEPIFNSFFANAADDPKQTAAARALLSAWTGPGPLVVVTHQVNITALTGIVPASGEGVVVERHGPDLKVVGRIAAPR